MIHFFPHFADSVERMQETPFAQELRRLKVEHRFFMAKIDLTHRNIFELLFRVYPSLTFMALRKAIASLVHAETKPDFVVLTTEVEVIVFGLVRLLTRLKPLIVFETFIFTKRENSLKGRLHLHYMKIALQFADIALSHSRHEAREYAAIFASTKCRFFFVPYGTSVDKRAEFIAFAASQPSPPLPVIVSAGRSSRDYRTLLQAVAGLPCKLRIIAYNFDDPIDPRQREQVEILQGYFGEDYLRELAKGDIVAIPLSRDAVSAGQMVLLQASALRKPIIITRTTTTEDYVTDGETALTVPLKDVSSLQTAIVRLLNNPGLRDRLAANAAERFEKEFCTEAYVRAMVASLASTQPT